MRLIRCARTTPPPPKLTVSAVFPGKVSTAHASVVAGSAPESAAARSRTWAALNIRPTPQVAQLDESIEHPGGARGHVLALGVDHEFRRERLLVRVRDAGELGHLPGQRPAIQPFGVAANAFVERGFHVHFDERTDRAAHFIADGAVRGNGGGDHDHAVAGEQLRDVADAPDVGVAVLAREAQALGEILAYLVSVEQLDPNPLPGELAAYRCPERRLPCSRETGEPQGEPGRCSDPSARHLGLSHRCPSNRTAFE